MDGTIANFYGVDNWLQYLIEENTFPYQQAKPLFNMQALARVLHRLQKQGYYIGIVSWLSKNGTDDFNSAVTATKKAWLKKHLSSVTFDEIKIIPYGINKATVVKYPHGILFDDEEQNRKLWQGIAYTQENIINILKTKGIDEA